MNAHTVTWYIGMTITILVVLWMFYLVLWPASLWPKKQAETKEGEERKKWREYNGFVVVFTIITFHLIGYGIWEMDWFTYVLKNTWVIVLHLPLIIYGVMTPQSTWLYHHVVGKVMIPIIVIGMLVIVVKEIRKASQPQQQSSSVLMGANAPTPKASVVPLPTLRAPINDENALRVLLMQKLCAQEISEQKPCAKEGLDMQWDLIRIAKRESNFKQNGPDGKVIHGEDNPDDTCMFMVNTVKQADVVAKHDLGTLDGCVDAAIEIYRKDPKDPMHPWFLSDDNDAVRTGEKVYIAPVGEWSVEIPTGYGATEVPDDWIEVITNTGAKYELGKPGVTGEFKTPYSDWIKIRSKTEMSVNVTVIP